MRDDTIAAFLDQLAARVPAPGGGATAALHAAQVAHAVPVRIGEAPRVHLIDDPAAPVGGAFPGPGAGAGLRTGQGGR